MPKTISDLLWHGTDRLKQSGIDSARLDCLLILEKIFKRDRIWLLANLDYDHVDSVSVRLFQQLIEKRCDREPLAYLLGRVWFYGLEFISDRRALIPRPETEALVQFVIEKAPDNACVLDLGTGSGAIAISLAVNRSDLSVTASDITKPALGLAIENASKYHIHDIEFIQSDLMNDIKKSFDFIVANLPYLPSDQKIDPETSYEPSNALYGGIDGLKYYRRLFQQLSSHLLDNGHLVIEAEPKQKEPLRTLAGLTGYQMIDCQNYRYVFVKT